MLPDDILSMVCTQLWHQQDFNTLFNCACSGKRLATLTIPNLYRMQGVSSAINGDSNDGFRAFDKVLRVEQENPRWLLDEQIFMKCAGLWRTIILSSLGKTLYPYCRYMRTLDLRDLEELLTNRKFSAKMNKDFFRGELAQFENDDGKAIKDDSPSDADEIINRIGEAITKQTPLLRELAGKVRSGALSRWIPRLPQLTHLKIWHGAAVEANGKLIRLHCPSFKRLDFLYWEGRSADRSPEALLNELCPQSLESFENTRHFQNPIIGRGIFKALSCHEESLVNLNVTVGSLFSVPTVSLLAGCTNLVSLSLDGIAMDWINLEELDKKAFLEMVAWLKECKKLRFLALNSVCYAPALIASVLSENTIHLTSLILTAPVSRQYEGFIMRDTEEFLHALANQTSLQRLWLKGGLEEHTEYETNSFKGLVDSLSKLVNLMDLRLTEFSDLFFDRHIVQLAGHLPKLEVWSTRGFGLTDTIWGKVASLRSLRALNFGPVTSFTAEGILEFISKLGPGNKGLILVLGEMSIGTITGAERKLIEERLAEKVGGTLEYDISDDRPGISIRDAETSSSEGDSDGTSESEWSDSDD